MNQTTWARGALSVWAGLALALGCGSGGDRGTGGTVGGSSLSSGGAAGGNSVSSGGATTGGVTAGGAGKGGSSGGSAGAQAGSSGSSSSTPMCYVDFPCRNAYRCVNSSSYVAQTTIDCHTVCGPGLCSGAMCQDAGSPIACPAGTRCVATGGFDDLKVGCRPIPDADVADGPGADAIDAPASEGGSIDTQTADRPVKSYGDVLPPWEGGTRPPMGDAYLGEVTPICMEGQTQCRGSEPSVQTCESGQWHDSKACDYACRAGACSGECEPGARRRCRADTNHNTTQVCNQFGHWDPDALCSGSTPYCATGQCVATCQKAGEDCTSPTAACCPGTECIADESNIDTGGTTPSVCKAIPACAIPGHACTADTDCCAGMDCKGGTCSPKQTGCLDVPSAGVCGGNSGATCCPGTECSHQYSFEPLGCAIASGTRVQEIGCPKDQPAFHEACRASKFGLGCTYYKIGALPPAFYTCTCSYYGWSCTKGYRVH